MRLRYILLLLLFSVFGVVSTASAEIAEDRIVLEKSLEKRAGILFKSLRCVKCQNQSIGDSEADIAKEMRKKTRALLEEGASDQQIKDYFSERYGSFVLYTPPFSLRTAPLWLSPVFILLLFAGLVFFYYRAVQKRKK